MLKSQKEKKNLTFTSKNKHETLLSIDEIKNLLT